MDITMHHLQLAEQISKINHKDMKYGTLDYFSYHVEGVVQLLHAHRYSTIFIVVGYLHDILEDTDVQLPTIYNLFGEEVGDAVKAITKLKGETDVDYYARCRSNPIAKAVKVQDLSFNLTNCLKNKNKEKFKKYTGKFALLNS